MSMGLVRERVRAWGWKEESAMFPNDWRVDNAALAYGHALQATGGI